ncbi:M20/M25/M40 family metallo-hydrolase [Chitinophaga sp. GCM10012297]|uniref:M20/M25/M40 family metallo-hydrolase n=1 Tax=Chitinophaga chungangae TaxID=2821488 RepID=A0ABS3YCP1_9BACT|nr:M20/M25/M40 family metallo-hydrolase [Chitinophaga chungangae]MBO9152441.1 M20/M25/M40 family metallo-hydrolase [Chitinophaga chungangae]
MKLSALCLLGVLAAGIAPAQAQQISEPEVTRIISTLAADSMQGRMTYTPGIEKASVFIAEEFRKAGLEPLPGEKDFLQRFITSGRKVLPLDSASAVAEPKHLHNLAGMIKGSSKPDEYVIFSAHYDHIGIQKAEEGDSIANGADDDASGVTAVILLANYFREHAPERSVIFAAFTAEEIGGFGSRYFSRQLDPAKIVAMFNIEMIGKESKFGRNSAFITGFERSDFGKILQANLEGSSFRFYPDPYPEQRLFYRSDNATLARLGVPAHTISTTQIDKDTLYHSVNDEVESLDMKNIADIIEAIAVSSGSIVGGKDAPTRIAPENKD